ncbi:hypothetical protein [Okeania sp. SIO3I5]|nr:hypothetical protein [Okeania sp. SIO3I5]
MTEAPGGGGWKFSSFITQSARVVSLVEALGGGGENFPSLLSP